MLDFEELSRMINVTKSRKKRIKLIKDAYKMVREEELSTISERIDVAESLDDIFELADDVYRSHLYVNSCRYEKKAISIIEGIQDHKILISFKEKLYELLSFINKPV